MSESSDLYIIFFLETLLYIVYVDICDVFGGTAMLNEPYLYVVVLLMNFHFFYAIIIFCR